MEKLRADEVNFIYNTLNEMFPNAKCELNYNNLYELIVAVVLSAQTTDARVNIVSKELFKKYPTCYDLSIASYEEVKEIIKPLGLSKTKTNNIIKLSKELVDRFNGTIPSNRDELMSLSGVGRKTANVVLSEGYKIPSIAVDTHVSRIANRLGLSNSNDTLKIEEDLCKQFPKENWHKTHHLLLFFGRYFCKAQNPNCEECPFKNKICKKKKV